ncbi:MAG: 4-hydroxythreonine-4-phosphate dehydrogenase PdxA [Pseudomonadota bacterium]
MSTLAITIGDPAGIGPELVLKAWRALRQTHPHARHSLIAYGCPDVLRQYAELLKIDVPIVPIATSDIAQVASADALPVCPIALAERPVPGSPSAANAPMVIEAITAAVNDAMAGRVDGVVTCPIAKHVLQAAGFEHPGHTEFLAALARQHVPTAQLQPIMMLAAPALRVVPVTIHCALRDVPEQLTADLLKRTIVGVHRALIADLGLAAPRIAVTGLNPHAGENGAMGDEEIEIIAPVIANLQSEGLRVSGPCSADTLFHASARADYDVAVCMYHDQALIPLKTLDFDGGVNVTLGLPFVRTSPDHGTAFDIAGQNKANVTSVLAALDVAGEIARHRAVSRERAIS